MLQKKKQRSSCIVLEGRSVSDVVHEPDRIIKEIQAFEEAAKNLSVVTVNPLASYFERVFTANDGEVIAHVRSPEDFIDGRFQKERLAETEGEIGGTVYGTNVRIRYAGGIRGVARTILAS